MYVIGSSSSPELTNCMITNNTVSDTSGGGVYCYLNSTTLVTNCTIAGNSANTDGGGIYCLDASAQIINSILWKDTAGGIANPFARDMS